MTFDVSALAANEVEVDGCSISYRLAGAGRPLLLVMGLGADVSAWQDHVSAYSEQFRCILIDNRGAGRSGTPPGPYSARQMADDCARVVSVVTDEPAAVVGLSMGGAVAQEFALRHRSLVRRLVLVSTWARCDGYLSEIFDHLDVAHSKLGPDEFAQLVQLRIWSPSYFSDHVQELQAARRPAAAVAIPHHAFAAQCAACKSHDALSRLGDIDAPTLIAGGRDDSFTVLEHAERIHRAISSSQLEAFPGGHAHHWENLKACNDLTLTWLDDRHSRHHAQTASGAGMRHERKAG
jgi:pimeloyl-ACP methyl ester carboxylesterase